MRTPTPIGGEEAGGDRLVRLRADDDRRRVAGARVGERARLRIVHGQQHGGEVAAQVLVDHAAGDLQGHARLEARLEVGAQRVAHEGGAGQRAAAVAGHVAEDEADAAAGQRKHVVEVAARAGAVGRPVGHRGAQRADLVGHRREQRGLEQADLLEQLAALPVEAAVAKHGHQRGEAEQRGEHAGHREGTLERHGHLVHELRHRADDRRAGLGLLGLVRTSAPVGRVGAAVAAALRPADLLEGRSGRRRSGLELRLGAAHAGDRAGAGQRALALDGAPEADAVLSGPHGAVAAERLCGRRVLRDGRGVGRARVVGRGGVGAAAGVAGRGGLRVRGVALAATGRRRRVAAVALAATVVVAGRRSGVGRRSRGGRGRRGLGDYRIGRVGLVGATLAPAISVAVAVAVPGAVPVAGRRGRRRRQLGGCACGCGWAF